METVFRLQCTRKNTVIMPSVILASVLQKTNKERLTAKFKKPLELVCNIDRMATRWHCRLVVIFDGTWNELSD